VRAVRFMLVRNGKSMKRDMDLVRKILFEIEAYESPRGMGKALDIDGFDSQVVSGHVQLLKDAGLVRAIDASSCSGLAFIPIGLTWQGHEFLESARNDNLWNRAKEKVLEETGGMSIDVLKAVLINLATSLAVGP
jgi:hypothetical protein